MTTALLLRVERGPDAGRDFPLTAEGTVVGRQAGVDAVLADPLASRRHARLEVRDGRILLTDLGSANGTRVNGQAISGSVWLRPGDLIAIGDTVLRLAEVSPEAVAEARSSATPPAHPDAAERATHLGISLPQGERGTAPAGGQPPEYPQPGKLLSGRYRLDRLIGRGGFARVYLATDLTLRRPIAVKVLDPDLVAQAEDQDFLARFAAEAQSVAVLDHPNILGIHDYGQDGGTAYLVMPYVEGGTLHDRLRAGGRLGLAEAGRYLRQAASALDYAHRRGIVHRDIKPQNMLLRAEDDRLLLADFGIAKVLSGASTHSRTGVAGTVAYMAPEQFRGAVGRATDVYALGCVLFQLLTGQLPYNGTTEQVIYAHLLAPIPSLDDRTGQLPAAMQAVIERALAKKPEERFGSAGELLRAFEAARATGAGVTNARTVQFGERTPAEILAPTALAAEAATAAPAPAPTLDAAPPRPEALDRTRAPEPAGPLTSQPTVAPAPPSPPPSPPHGPVPAGEAARSGRFSRRTFIIGATGFGVSVLAFGSVLAVRGIVNGRATATTGPDTGGEAPDATLPPATAVSAPAAVATAAATATIPRPSSALPAIPTVGPATATAPAGSYQYTLQNPPPVANAATRQYAGAKLTCYGERSDSGNQLDVALAQKFLRRPVFRSASLANRAAQPTTPTSARSRRSRRTST